MRMQCRRRPRLSDRPHNFSPISISATFPRLWTSTSTPCTFSSLQCFLFWLWWLYFLIVYLSYTTVSSFLSLHFLHDLMPLHFKYLQAWTEAENKWLKMTSTARPMTNAWSSSFISLPALLSPTQSSLLQSAPIQQLLKGNKLWNSFSPSFVLSVTPLPVIH